MRKITLFLTMLLLCTSAIAQDYSTHYDGQTKSTRPINSVSLQSPTYGESKLELSTSENNSLYVDRTSDITFRCRVGETVTPNTGYTDGWMHTFVYLDQDKNGFVVSDVNAEDLVSFAYYNGKNSLGNTVADNVVAAPAFVAPETPGTYRLRFKIDWNDLDPGGSQAVGETMQKNNGGIIDVMLEVVEERLHSITYNYKNNGVLVGSITHNVAEGSSFPDLVSGLYGVIVNGTKPSGTVLEDGEYDIAVTLSEFPFEYYESYADIETSNGWYNLVMHSNHNTGNGTEKYRTYLGANEGTATTLAWGVNKYLENAGDIYYWGFVGNPISGFRVVNKAKGDGYILSSNGSANPLMLEEVSLSNSYNTTWNLSARKYGANEDGDFVKKGDWFCLKYPGSSNNYINANAGNGNVAYWNDNDNGSAILAVKPITINAAAGVATYFSETSIKLPESSNISLYYANNVENGYVKLQNLDSTAIVYPETGLVVKLDTEENYTLAPQIESPGTVTAPEGNLLKGTTKRTLITKGVNTENYVLAMVDSNVGFYRAVNGENKGEFYNGAFRAYLETTTTQGTAAFYGFDWGETTGIETLVPATDVNAPIYDLSGRRVLNTVKGGVYIQNGKKFIVK